jgi:hypothetical protein
MSTLNARPQFWFVLGVMLIVWGAHIAGKVAG